MTRTDANYDGIQTPDEPLVPGLSVRLMKGGVAEGNPMTTGSDGAYSFLFARDSAAEYTVQFEQLTGHMFADACKVADYTVDSDAEANGITLPVASPSARNVFISAALAGQLKADIDIAGKIKVGTTESVFTEEDEDTIGGLVLMNSNSNNALRKKVTTQQILDANNAPVPNVKVEVSGKARTGVGRRRSARGTLRGRPGWPRRGRPGR